MYHVHKQVWEKKNSMNRNKFILILIENINNSEIIYENRYFLNLSNINLFIKL